MSDDISFELRFDENDPMLEKLERAREYFISIGYKPKDLGDVIRLVFETVAEYLTKEKGIKEITSTEYANAVLFQLFPQLFPHLEN